VYELFVDPNDPSKLNPNDRRDNVGVKDGIAARPALGSKSHEGMRFDKQGNHYGISETAPGGIYRFVLDKKGDLSEGQLRVLRTENGQDGKGAWVDIPDAAARTNAQAAATELGNGYSRPEDVETGESTGVDRNNGGNTLYVVITGTDDPLAVDLSSKKQPFACFYVNNQPRPTSPTPNATAEFDSPDNLALDRRGDLAITEDPPGNPVGADIWIAKPPRGNDRDDEGGQRRQRCQPASEVERFASLKDCAAEPTGIYFALEGTEEFSSQNPDLTEQQKKLVTGESLFVNRQHSGQGTTNDQFISIAPVDDGNDDEGNGKDKDEGEDKKRD
jgi:uncharacterized protein